MRLVSAFRYAFLVAAAFAVALPPAARAQYFRFGKNKVQYEAADWHYVQSEHFDVYYYEGGYELADFTAKASEAAYAQVKDLLGHEIADRIPILVYQSHNDFAVTNAAELPTYSEGIGGVTELFKNRVAVPFMADYREYRRVLHHELVHAVMNDMFYGGSIQSILQNNIQLRIPLWLSEGLAEYAALGWDTNSDMYVREAVLEDHLAPIPYLNGYFAYRGGQSVWDYIAEQYGREKVAEILQRIKLTRSVEGAFQRATGLGLEDLSVRWQKALKEVYFPEVAAREDLDDIARALVTGDDGLYNTSPALSPQGDRVAYVSTRGALFDVFLASANDGQVIRKLVDGQDNTAFESLRILSPGLTWSPDGERIAIAVKSGRSDAIVVVEVETGETTHYRIPGIDQILAVAWSPDGERIAFEGSADAQGDIFVLDLASRTTTNYTNDVFSDHEPAWSPDGQALVFHSDRGSYLDLGRYTADTFDMASYDYSQDDLYRLDLGATRLERLTTNEGWDERTARFGADPDRLLFLSDRNGVFNLYEKDLTTGAERPLTDVVVGLTQLSLSADGERAAVLSLKDGTPSIYLLQAPFERRLDREVLVPNVWAQRALQEAPEAAPAVELAPSTLRAGNPFLRDAVDGVAYERRRDRPRDRFATRSPFFAGLSEDPAAGDNPGDEPEDEDPATDPAAPSEADSAAYGGVRVDFRNYVFSDAFDTAAVGATDTFRDRFDPADNIDEESGRYKPKRYKLIFSPDLIYGTAGYDVLYGAQGVTQMLFSDMLGNHQIFVATNLLIDLRNSDYVVSYNYLPRRVDWSLSGFHLSRLLPDYNLGSGRVRYYRYRQYGTSVSASYPIDKFRRVDVDLDLLGVSQADITDPTRAPVARALFHPSVTYTKDVTTPGQLYPIDGHRVALRVSGSPAGLGGEPVRFVTLLGDARTYTSFGRGRYSFAFRLSGGTSLGPEPQLFYTAGVQNWLNRAFDQSNGFPIDEVSDFIFATPVLPLRGSEINSLNGSHFGLLNAEFRFPLVAAVLPGPLPILPLYNLEGSAFVDAGTVWGGRSANRRFNVFTERDGERVLDDLLVGTGFGLRTILLGYPVRVDVAWPFDGRRLGDRRTYFSVGFDF